MQPTLSPSLGGTPGESIYCRLLGKPVLTSRGSEHPLAAERRYQLLAYLACHDGWVPRLELAALFWETHTPDAARRNLRRLIHDIRRLPWAASIEAVGDSLRWRIPTDLEEFTSACAASDWARSIRIGSRTLLDGLEHNATEPYHDWLRYERERQLRQWRESVARRRAELHADPIARLELSLDVLGHDAHNEAAVQDAVETLRGMGREADARKVYDEFVARLRADLGVEPTLQLRTLAAGSPAALPAAQRRAHPAPADECIGRRLEQGELLSLILRDDCRRLTVHGPGGVGKSLLARATCEALAPHFPDGVHWVGLRDLNQGSQVAARLAAACGFKLALSQDPLASIASRIGDGRRLFVLDNCEHLQGICAFGDRLLQACPNIKILHTSRSRIGCSGEWVLPLNGLAVPDADEREWEVLGNFDSVRLFEARASQNDPRFDTRRHRGDVVALVRALDGLPLAIEMAAASVRVLPPAAILEDMSRLFDLEHPAVAAPHGERTLRASFRHSWDLLTPAERGALSSLAAFGGSFTLAAAAHAADAHLPVLASLVDKSLVHAAGNGRFSLHPLVRQLAAEKAADFAAARNRHAAYFAERLAARATASDTPWGDEDVAACVEAWRWATGQRSVALLLRMAQPMVRLINAYLRWEEGLEVLGGTLAVIEGRDGDTQRLRAVLLHGIALCRLYNGEMVAAEDTARRSLRCCASVRMDSIVGANMHIVGFSLAWRGDMAGARRFFEQSLARSTARRDFESVAKAQYGLAFLAYASGDYAGAARLYREVANLGREHRLAQWTALSLNGAAKARLMQGWPAEALAFVEEGLAVCEANDVHGRRSFLDAHRGLALLRMGEPDAAHASIARAIAEARDWNIWTARMEAHLARATLAAARAEEKVAREHVREAMRVSVGSDSASRRLGIVRHWGEWLVRNAHAARGAAVLAFVQSHPLAMRCDQDAAASALQACVAAAERKACEVTASGLTFEGIEREVLAED